jgi:Tol biopolymer transport system component/tRNA A-37 threonylcarbamoyl transferase component Bud32
VTTFDRLTTSLADRYRLERELGQGGMATVYLAEDLRHGRKVAIKVLHPELSAVIGGERFLAEIRLTAQLQHPHILGLIDSGECDGLLYYVMPFIDGESLRGRLTREKQLPVDEALRLAREVAAALDYAHKRGIVHRDIKPENILLQDGAALVADFGIALAVQQAGGHRMTQTGLSLGTPSYMSPEQAMGEREVTPRADVYALGAMTYEMLAGEPPFTGSSAQAIVARVLTEAPRSISAQRKSVPPHVEATIMRALEKLPADRWTGTKEFADALADAGRFPGAHSATIALPATRRARASRGMLLPVLLGLTILLALVAIGLLLRRPATVTPRPVLRFTLDLAPGTRIATPLDNPLAISPDGNVVAFSGRAGTGPLQLFVRRLDELQEHALDGTEDARQPFFSPDGKWIGFFAKQQLKKIPVGGGPPIRIAEVPGFVYGASWMSDGRIVLSRGISLAMVPDIGGALSELWPNDSARGRLRINPRVLPGDRTVMFTVWSGSAETAVIGMGTIGVGERADFRVTGTYVLGSVDEYLVYMANGTALAVRLDAAAGRVVGQAVPVLEGIGGSSLAAAWAALSPSGSLVQQAGSMLQRIVLVDRQGVERTRVPERRAFANPRLSPDGARIAVSMESGGRRDIWVYDLRSRTLSRVTTEGDANDRPEWMPDGRRVVFRSTRSGEMSYWSQAADGSGKAELLVGEAGARMWEGVLTADGRALVYRTGSVGTADIWLRRLDADTTRRPLATTAFTEWGGRPSPDGLWIAYESDETGAFEVYVRPLSDSGTRQKVSVNGGVEPIWSRDGSTLYYWQDDELFTATLSATGAVTRRDTLFRGDLPTTTGHANYDVSADGTEILLLRPSIDSMRTVVIYNWADEMRARVAATHR